MAKRASLSKIKCVSKQDRSYYGHVAIMLILMFGFGKLPPIAPLTPLGMEILGAFLGMIYGWGMIDLILPSLLGMLTLGFTGIQSTKNIFLIGFGDDLTLFILFFLVLATIINDAGVSDIIANWFMSRKIASGRPWVFSTLIFLATYVIGMAISLIASIVIMWQILDRICDVLDIPKADKYREMMISGIWFSAILGYSIFPFKPLPAMVMASYKKLSGVSVDFLGYMQIGIVTSLVGLFCYLLFCRYVVRPDLDKIKQGGEKIAASMTKIPMTRYQRIILVTLLGVVLVLLLTNTLPEAWIITQWLRMLGSTGVIIAAIVFLGLLRVQNQRMVDIKAAFSKGAPWDICIMVAAVIPFSGCLIAEETGIMPFVGNCFAPLLNGVGNLGFGILMIIGCLFLLQVVNNVAVVAIMIPLIYGFAVQLQLSATVVVILLGMISNTALLTPGASAQGAMFHSHEGFSGKGKQVQYIAVILSITAVTMICIGWPLGNCLFALK